MCTNELRVFGQKTIRVVVTPQDSSVSPVDVMARVLHVFGGGRENDGGAFVLRSMNTLQVEIRCKKRKLTRNIRHHGRLCSALKNAVSSIVHTRVLSIVSQIVQKLNNNVTERHSSKLNRVREHKRANGTRTPKLDLVMNLLSRILTTDVHHAT